MVAGSRRADVEILLRVSRMYYEQGLMQSEIAARIGYSRPHVSRLLAQARERGIVRVSISHPLERILAIEADLRRRLPIASIRVAEVPDSDTMGAIGRAAAELLADTLLDGQVLAVGNGRSIAAAPPAAHPGQLHRRAAARIDPGRAPGVGAGRPDRVQQDRGEARGEDVADVHAPDRR